MFKKKEKKLPKIQKKRKRASKILKLRAKLLKALGRVEKRIETQTNVLIIKTKSKKRKGQVGQAAAPKKRFKSLENAIEQFSAYCECGRKLEVHGHGTDNKTKKEVISASCGKRTCSFYRKEVKFTGDGKIFSTEEKLAVVLKFQQKNSI